MNAMKKWFIKSEIVFGLLAFVLVCLISSCGSECGGTETGNPSCSGAETAGTEDDDTADSGDDSAADATAPITGILMGVLCDAVDACYTTFDDAECAEQIQTDVDALSAFGADTDLYTSFDELQEGIDAGDVEVDTAVYEECLDDIAAVSCAAMTSDNVFTESASNYTRVERAVPDSCGDLF